MIRRRSSPKPKPNRHPLKGSLCATHVKDCLSKTALAINVFKLPVCVSAPNVFYTTPRPSCTQTELPPRTVGFEGFVGTGFRGVN